MNSIKNSLYLHVVLGNNSEQNIIYTNSRVTFKTYLGMGSPQKYHIKWYMPKCLPYPEVSEITRLKCPILVRAEKSKMASKMAAFKNY